MVKDAVRQADRTCCGVIREAKNEAREKHARRPKPQPWIVLKLTVGLTIMIIGYSSYVYLGRFCVPMMLKHDSALGSQATGISFCVVCCLLLIMVIWTYAKVVFTPPGYAKDVVSKSAEPYFAPPHRPQDINDIGGTEYQAANSANHSAGRPSRPRTNSTSQHEISSTQKTSDKSQKLVRSSSTTRSSVSTPAAVHKPVQQNSRRNTRNTQGSDDSANVSDALPALSGHDLEDGRGPNTRSGKATVPLAPMRSRRPPTTPILLPEHRYCYLEELYKPYRTHHCRVCGTCVLKYDHHCPWVGQCVGARNHKFFVNFVLWVALFCLWIFSTLLALIVKESSKPNSNLDPQEIVVIALAGIFGFFTIPLFATHVYLICLNQTTVESLGFRDMTYRENGTLAEMHPWYRFGAKKRTLRQWDAEWGRIGREGNIWWMGSKRQNWEAVMGRNIWWWFLPIGRSSSDGTTYPVNPRFDAEGRWRPRAEWPSKLR